MRQPAPARERFQSVEPNPPRSEEGDPVAAAARKPETSNQTCVNILTDIFASVPIKTLQGKMCAADSNTMKP